ncbi:glycosyltransferase family 4 protein [Ilyomonas limi]|uniref:Glycosyltransferase family 4 protein n=1 Tax=Ilyomonas limi TaxID=2575867 RepID=A0A4V5UU73_9BACT|nr:glycosyltransferase family 4 protein [Ilyomonas limi]TKK67973.1 glycosyltransferase family 4 protein [Ilyomonas limi]
MKPKPKVAIVTNIAWNIYNFRRGLANAIKEAGYEPILMAADDEYAEKLKREGWHFIPLKNMERAGMNPLADVKLMLDFIKIYKENDIKCALHYNSKPLIYASLSASFLKIPYLPTITGLAGPFSGNRTITSKIVTLLYRYSLRNSYKVLFQNNEDLRFFLDKKITQYEKTIVVPGSGVNLDEYQSAPFSFPPGDKIVFLMLARLSRAKGVEYYVHAARAVKKRFPNAIFRLAGPFECDELAISRQEVDGWQREGAIEYVGVSDGVKKEISEAHVIVYPSYYREGIPKALIESAAMSRPIITTDNVGCREVVQHGVNGFLVPIKNTEALAKACERFILLSEEEKIKFSTASRKISQQFDEKKVLPEYISLIDSCLNKGNISVSVLNYDPVALTEVQ